MKQMPIDESLLVAFDYDAPGLSAAVRQFKPALYKEEELFCCLLGPDTEDGIYACGATEDEALKNWDIAFKERLKSKGENDEVAQYIKDTLATSKKDVW